ncbi:MAG: C-GCAxxG-C-C family protein [Gammaproteobacteria bacterium]
MDKQELGAAAYQKALDYDLKYGCCPQCVLTAVQETVGVVDDSMIKASHGLSGGGGLMGAGACGALTGGLLALGARYGRDRDKLDRGRGMADFQRGKVLVEKFRGELGGITCEDLQRQFTGRTYDLWDAGEYKAFGEARGLQCAHASGLVAKWVVEMLSGQLPGREGT